MAIIDCNIVSAQWSLNGTWVGGVPPGPGDWGRINAGATIVYDSSATVCMGFILNGGILAFEKHFEISDDATAGIIINAVAGGALVTNASKSAPRIFYNESGGTPINRCKFLVYDIVGADNRVLDFKYCQFLGFKPFLGNDSQYIEFNTGEPTAPKLISVIPPLQDINNLEHNIKGRTTGGRVYPSQYSARVMTISGIAHVNNYLHDQIKDMVATKQRIACMTDRACIPKGWIDRARIDAPRGLFQAFSITVKEDTNV